jgi:hypothetical protein
MDSKGQRQVDVDSLPLQLTVNPGCGRSWIISNLLGSYSQGYDTAKRKERQRDEARGAALVHAARRGGMAKRGYRKVPAEDLREAFSALRRTVKDRSEACRRVARQYRVSAETVRKYTRDLPW